MLVLEDNVSHDGAHTVVDAEACFVPGVKREEDSVVGKEPNALGELRPHKGGLEVTDVCHMVVKKLCFGLVQELVGEEVARLRATRDDDVCRKTSNAAEISICCERYAKRARHSAYSTA